MDRTGDLPFLDFLEADFSTRSKPVAEARNLGWCARTPFGLAVLRFRETGQLLRDKRLRQGSYAWPDRNALTGSFAEFWKRSIISMEGENHKRLRMIAMAALAPEYIESLAPEFHRIAQELATPLREHSRCEFMQDFSVPFAGQAICVLLGMQPREWELISHDASDLGLAMGIDCKIHEPVFNAACDRLTELAKDLIARARNGADRESYVARLVTEFENAGLRDEQALLDLVVISIFGGVDTTRSQLGFAISLFIEHPGQWQLLRGHPDLVPQAIEECIRTWPTTTWATREAIEDFVFQGQEIAKGETVHLLVNASATDPEIHEDTGFDISIRRKSHFGFGGGAHHCLGALVARTDMACALGQLAATFQTIEFDGVPEYLPDSGNTSPVRLPIRYKVA